MLNFKYFLHIHIWMGPHCNEIIPISGIHWKKWMMQQLLETFTRDRWWCERRNSPPHTYKGEGTKSAIHRRIQRIVQPYYFIPTLTQVLTFLLILLRYTKTERNVNWAFERECLSPHWGRFRVINSSLLYRHTSLTSIFMTRLNKSTLEWVNGHSIGLLQK